MRLDDFVLAARRRGPRGFEYADMVELVERLELPDELVAAHVQFDQNNYARNLILRTPAFELLAICWRPGQHSTIHDHGGSVNVVRVFRGQLTSRLFAAIDGEPARMTGQMIAGPGAHASVDRQDIHQLGNQSNDDLVTIHVYSPPLTKLGVFSAETAARSELALRYSLLDDLG